MHIKMKIISFFFFFTKNSSNNFRISRINRDNYGCFGHKVILKAKDILKFSKDECKFLIDHLNLCNSDETTFIPECIFITEIHNLEDSNIEFILLLKQHIIKYSFFDNIIIAKFYTEENYQIKLTRYNKNYNFYTDIDKNVKKFILIADTKEIQSGLHLFMQEIFIEYMLENYYFRSEKINIIYLTSKTLENIIINIKNFLNEKAVVLKNQPAINLEKHVDYNLWILNFDDIIPFNIQKNSKDLKKIDIDILKEYEQFVYDENHIYNYINKLPEIVFSQDDPYVRIEISYLTSYIKKQKKNYNFITQKYCIIKKLAIEYTSLFLGIKYCLKFIFTIEIYEVGKDIIKTIYIECKNFIITKQYITFKVIDSLVDDLFPSKIEIENILKDDDKALITNKFFMTMNFIESLKLNYKYCYFTNFILLNNAHNGLHFYKKDVESLKISCNTKIKKLFHLTPQKLIDYLLQCHIFNNQACDISIFKLENLQENPNYYACLENMLEIIPIIDGHHIKEEWAKLFQRTTKLDFISNIKLYPYDEFLIKIITNNIESYVILVKKSFNSTNDYIILKNKYKDLVKKLKINFFKQQEFEKIIDIEKILEYMVDRNYNQEITCKSFFRNISEEKKTFKKHMEIYWPLFLISKYSFDECFNANIANSLFYLAKNYINEALFDHILVEFLALLYVDYVEISVLSMASTTFDKSNIILDCIDKVLES